MTRHLVPILALIAGSALLMMAGGLNGLILPMRGAVEGFSTFSLGLLGTGWAIGFIGGCLRVPRQVKRVGHVRTFGVLAAIATVSVLLSLLIIHPLAWIPLRALAGYAFAGAAMIVESWLNERTEAHFRGRVFGMYTMVNLLATTAGQMTVATGNPSGYHLFVLAAIFYVLALVPTALSRVEQPRPLVQSRLDLKSLVRNSPIAVTGAFLLGISNSAFGTLGVVFGGAINLEVTTIALMMSVSLLAGSAFQVPVGFLSDRFDRRAILASIASLAVLVDLYFIVLRPADPASILIAAALFGCAIYTMYPVILAHAFDHAEPDAYMKISGGLLLTFGVGGMAGPLFAGIAMAYSPAAGLFMTTFFAHLALACFALYRMTRREPVAAVDKKEFVVVPTARLSTPETLNLDPRTETREDRDDDGEEPEDAPSQGDDHRDGDK